MPKLPRDLSGLALAHKLGMYGYRITRQRGSHLRLTREDAAGDHHLTIPAYAPLKVGTLNSILDDVDNKIGISKERLVNSLFSQ